MKIDLDTTIMSDAPGNGVRSGDINVAPKCDGALPHPQLCRPCAIRVPVVHTEERMLQQRFCE